MFQTKQQLVLEIKNRREIALAILKPQWKTCERMRPKGHIFDGGIRCLYCGCRYGYEFDWSTSEIEQMVTDIKSWPIANNLSKEVAA